MTYQRPPEAIAALVNLKPDPLILFGPDRHYILIADRPGHPSIEELREPKIRLAGRQINPANFTPAGSRGLSNPRLHRLRDGHEEPIRGLPADARLRYFNWSPSGKYISFCLHGRDGLQLWVAERATLQASPIGAADLNNSLGGAPYDFLGDDTLLVKRRIPGDSAPDERAPVSGPNVQDTSGRAAANRTYTHLLQNKHDADVFRHYARGQLYLVDLTTGAERPWAKPGIIAGVGDSPDGNYFLITYVREPFSYRVPYEKFADDVWLLDRAGREIRHLAQRPAAEHLPPAFGSVITGPRRFQWRSDRPATLYWTEALDEGDPRKSVRHREQLYRLDAPFTGEPRPSIRLPLRYGGISWSSGELALVVDWSWHDRRQVVRRWWPDQPERSPEVIHDLNFEDQYADPGSFVQTSLPSGHAKLLTRNGGRELLLSGGGHHPEGSRPFVDAYDLERGTTRRLWSSQPPHFERPAFFLDDHPDWFLLSRESTDERPNYFLRHVDHGEEVRITDFPHPYPQLRDASYRKVHYRRADGVRLSGDLHTPRGFRPGTDEPLPVLMWAYPQEYKNAENAGQVTTSPHQFTRISPLSPLPFLAAGFAVFDDFAMPIVGEGDEEPNETFVEQVRLNAEAAVAKLIELGVADPKRIYVGGHSYGAFMTAHLLAHTDLFAGGIARSGAYNRTLTPFGFQAEERNFWEVPETYIELSPFVHADKIGAPLLLIHGEDDANSGTYPVQSKRMFAALNELGKTARLCLLPYEDHAYAAEESLLHMLWEMHRWMSEAEE